MKVYLFRHGEVENPEGVLYGRLPGFHLSKLGREHVRKSAERLYGHGITRIYSSPLERTIETSQIIAEMLKLNQDDIVIDPRLIESDVSKWQGTDLKEYKKKVVFALSARTQKEFEPIGEAGRRVLSVLEDPIKLKNENAIVVSHGDPLVGVLINLTGDWSFVDYSTVDRRYIQKGEYVRLALENDKWKIEEYSY